MDQVQAAAAPPVPRQFISPAFCVGCGIVLIMGAGLTYWLEPGRTTRVVPMTDASVAEAVRARAARLDKERAEREAQQRAEQERLAAEEAAEKARRAMLLTDGTTEAQARSQREEMARRQSAVEEARRTAEEGEDAWKRFYQPSAACRDPAASATVGCVNEYVKAKRAFEERRTTAAAR